MSERTCGNCRWWRYDLEFSVDGFPLGQCRRDSPIQSNEWPQVSANDFCGEWTDGSVTPEQEHDPGEDHELEVYVAAVRELVPGADRAVVQYWYDRRVAIQETAQKWLAFLAFTEQQRKGVNP